MTKQPANPNELATLASADFPIVGIGATGGIAALEQFFQSIPERNGLAFVIVTHLPAHRKRKLGEILQQSTRMPVVQAADGMQIQPEHIYVGPPGRSLYIEQGRLCLSEPDAKRNRRRIDFFLQSLAADQGTNAIAVILSGAGTDGIQGLRAVKAQGGLTLVQTPEEAEQAALPRRALATEQVDVNGPAHVLAQELLATRGKFDEQATDEQTELAANNEALSAILVELHMQTGHDLSHYKPSTILRRIARRLQIHALDNLSTYLAYLRRYPDETQALFKDCLISVTNFFRDAEDFAALEKIVIPSILASKPPNEAVRIWVPGCATGEEAYSLAILFYEHAAQMSDAPRLQIFATDIDEAAINVARRGLYPESIAKDITPLRLQRFFNKENDGYRVKLELREIVLFAVHNLLKDPPFSKLDLISCRNLLIYFNREAQEKTFELFHYALVGAPAEPGYLFLGTSESADAVANLFTVINKRYHLFQRRAAITMPRRLPTATLAIESSKIAEPAAPPAKPKVQSVEELYQQWTLRHYAPPRLLVNENYEVTHIFNGADRYLREREGSVTQNILLKVLPELRLDLRAALYQALNKGEHTDSRLLRVQLNKEWCLIQLHVGPVPEPGFPKEYVEVVFEERQETAAVGLPVPDTTPDKDASLISRLEEELLRTRARLHTIIEEHEIANDELKVSNEELQSINEELKSTTEELETSKEELQSMNEELVTVNHELKLKIEELGRVNSDLLNLMASTDVGAIFLDQSLRIKRFTPRATELFHLIETDTGRPFAHISPRLRHTRLIELAARVLSTLEQIEEIVQSDADRWYIMRMFPYRTVDSLIDGVVITLVDITELKRAEHEIEQRIQQQMVAELGRQALEGDDIDALMRAATQRVAEVLHVEFAKVLEAQADDQTLLFKAGVGWSETRVNEATLVSPDNTQSWYTFHEDQPIIVENIKQEKRFQPSPMLSAHNIVSGVTVVIPGHEALYGVLGVYSRETRAFTSYEVDFLQAVANVLAEALARQTIEDDLRTSETRFRHLADAMPQIVWVSDAVGDLRYVNQGWLDYSGILLAENLRDGVWAAVHPEDVAANRAAWEQALQSGNAYEDELRLRDRDGVYRWHLERGAPVRDANGVVMEWYTTATDIDDRKRMEEQLRYHAYLLEHIEDAVIATDKQLRVTAWNRGAEQIYGWQAPEVLGRSVQTVVNSSLTSEQRSPLLQAVEKNRRSSFEVMFHHHKDGTPLQLEANIIALQDADQQVIGYLSINRDIRERKKVEQQIKFQANLLDVVEQAVIAIGPTGKIIYWNRFAEQLYGWRADEVSGRNAVEVIPNTTTEEQAAAMATQFQKGSSWSGEFTAQHRNGTIFPVQVLNSPIYAENGTLLGFVGVSVDITERKAAEATLRRQSNMLEQTHDAIFMWDVGGSITYWNQGAEQLYGYTQAEAIGQSSHDLLQTVHPQPTEHFEMRLQRDGEWIGELQHTTKEGQTITVLSRHQLLREPDGLQYVLETSHDITDRKQAEEALQKNHALLQGVINGTNDGIYVRDVAGRYLLVNSIGAAIVGLTPEQMIGQYYQALFPTEVAAAIQAEDAPVLTTGEMQRNETFSLIDHVLHTFHSVRTPYRDLQGNIIGVLNVVRDITDRKQAEETLRESVEQLQLATTAANMGLWFWNIQTDTLIWTAQCKALFGLAPDDNITYARFLSILDPQDRARTDQAVQRTLYEPEEYNVEYRAVWPDASIHWLAARGRSIYDEAGHPIRMLGVVFDITERKQVEETLRENAMTIRQQLVEIEAIYATTPVGLAVLDRDLRQVRINEQLAAINGRSVAEHIGRTGFDLVPDIANTLDSQLQQVIATGEPLINLEITGITPAQPNIERTWLGSFYPLGAANGQVSGINVVVQEITDRKRHERELQELNKTLELRVAERTIALEERTQELVRRNRELDQFAYVASHDLKAPLRAIDNLSGWVIQDAQALLPAASQEHLDKLRGRVRRMEKLLDDLLDYSRADRYQYASETIEVGALIAEVTKLFTLPEGFTIAIDAVMPPLHTERVPLELVLRNLINNAIKHHSYQGDHKDRQPGEHPLGYMQITAHDRGDFVEFAVADNGPGIDPQFHERIFQMFQTLRPRDQVEGSGMGLAIVKKIIESRNGKISVESDAGQGATFRFIWPK